MIEKNNLKKARFIVFLKNKSIFLSKLVQIGSTQSNIYQLTVAQNNVHCL